MIQHNNKTTAYIIWKPCSPSPASNDWGFELIYQENMTQFNCSPRQQQPEYPKAVADVIADIKKQFTET